jgi:hypothetical protein
MEMASILIECSLGLRNQGPGLARDVFLNVHLFPPEGGATVESLVKNPELWTSENLGEVGLIQSYVSKDGFKLAPDALVEIVQYRMTFAPPFQSDYIIRLAYGHGHSPVETYRKEVTANELGRLYGEAVRDEAALERFQRVLLLPAKAI